MPLKAHLYLPREADDLLVEEVVFALTGVRINPDTRRKTYLVHGARCTARQTGCGHRIRALKDLMREGFTKVPSSIPKNGTAYKVLDAYVHKHHPDVIAYEKYLDLGLGTIDIEKGGAENGFTRERDEISALLLKTEAGRKLPPRVLPRINSVRWHTN